MNSTRWRFFFVCSLVALTGCVGDETAGSHNLGAGGKGQSVGGAAGRTAAGGSNGSGGATAGSAGSRGHAVEGGSSGAAGSAASGGASGAAGVTGSAGFGGAIATAGTGGAGGTGGTGGKGDSMGSGGNGAAGRGNTPGTAGGGGAAGSSSGGAPAAGNNVVPVIVDSGPGNIGTMDVPFISVTVCVPGTADCATIDHVSVDTGSTGLRIIASALPAGLKLPQQMTGGNPEAECFTFADGYVWGSVRLADLKIGGESASNMQLQVIGDPAYPTVPSDCRATGRAENTVADFGSNGLIGISQSRQDCGSYCSQAGAGYYSCRGSACTGVAMPIANQLANPVTLFAGDNNGAVLAFPTVPATGAAKLNGTLTFGVGTQANNALGSAQMLTVDADNTLVTVYGGKTMSSSFIDSGTNVLSFDNKNIAQCKGQEAGFYCPGSTTTEMATITGRNNVSTMITFSVANTDTLLMSGFSAFDNFAATGDSNAFDWGFPFFIGRTVFIGFALASSPGGGNGYVAY